jgi:hypothetical protein
MAAYRSVGVADRVRAGKTGHADRALTSSISFPAAADLFGGWCQGGIGVRPSIGLPGSQGCDS